MQLIAAALKQLFGPDFIPDLFTEETYTHTHTQVMLQGKRRMHKGILQSREWFALISTCQVQIGAINTINYKMKEFLSQ